MQWPHQGAKKAVSVPTEGALMLASKLAAERTVECLASSSPAKAELASASVERARLSFIVGRVERRGGWQEGLGECCSPTLLQVSRAEPS